MSNNTTICAAATAPIILGISVNDIYMIGMLIIALVSLVMPFVIAMINKSKVNEDDVKDALDDAKDTLEEIKKNNEKDA